MDDASMAGILFMAFGGLILIFAGLAAVSPGIVEIFLARAPGTFDKEHPKEFSRAWAKGLVLIALGPGVGGLFMYFLGKYGVILLLISFALFLFLGGLYISKKVKKIRGKQA